MSVEKAKVKDVFINSKRKTWIIYLGTECCIGFSTKRGRE